MSHQDLAAFRRLLEPAEIRSLQAGLSEHALHELGQIVAGSEDPRFSATLLSHVLEAIPEYADRAVIVALARAPFDQQPSTPRAQGPGA